MMNNRISVLAAFAAFLGIVSLPSGGVSAFLVSNPELQVVTPFLDDFAKAQEGVKLHVDLDIPEHVAAKKRASSSRLFINNLTIELKGGLGDDRSKTPLPDKYKGPAPITRTGPLDLETHSHGTFVSVKGTQTVKLEHGCWEMTWIMGRPSGSILCAFELAEDVTRNDAKLHAGRLYMSFPVFTEQGLEEMRLKKSNYELTYKKHSDKQQEELEKVNVTSNLFMKAVHFRRAVAANEKASLMRTNAYDHIPSNNDDLISLGDGLVLFKKGSVFSQRTDAEKGSAAREAYVGDAFVKQQ
mmetsp:Transcript_7605/g.8765  ORF Transcript_7605/g.8765 Transcript_7605/m.8765 type:complete len:298 (+) Transcript_7605:107-1000(+)